MHTTALDGLGIDLVAIKAYAEAEPLLQECLSTCESGSYSGELTPFREMSILGESLSGQMKFDEAERLLLQSIDGLKEHPSAKLKTETLRRLINLYEQWGRMESADQWRDPLTHGT